MHVFLFCNRASIQATPIFIPSDHHLLRFALIKPEAVKSGKAARIVQKLEDDGFHIVKQSEMTLTPDQAREFMQDEEGNADFSSLIVHLSRSHHTPMSIEF